VLVSVTDLSLGGLVCPWVRDVRAPGTYIGTSQCVIIGLRRCPARSLAPPLLRQNGVIRGLWVAYGFGWDFSSLGFLWFLYFPWLFTVGVESFLMGCTSAEVFWFVVFRPVRSSVVSTHSTGRFGVGQGQRVLPQGMRDGL